MNDVKTIIDASLNNSEKDPGWEEGVSIRMIELMGKFKREIYKKEY